MAAIQNLIDGLEIMKAVNPGAPVVSTAYVIMVPAVKQADLSDAQKIALEDAGWQVYSALKCYFFETIA